MDFADYPDHAAIRDAVAAITRSFGSSYYSAHAEGRIAITEPDAGSNTRRLSTTAVRDGGDWLLSGTKYYISGAKAAWLHDHGQPAGEASNMAKSAAAEAALAAVDAVDAATWPVTLWACRVPTAHELTRGRDPMGESDAR